MDRGTLFRPSLALFFFTLVCAAPAPAAVAPQIEYRGLSLHLNGYGEREILWTDVYRCALYLPETSSDRARIVDQRTAKVIRVTVLIDNLPDDMPARWRETLSDELNGEMFKRMKSAFRAAGAGDELQFGFVPGTGTEVRLNDEVILNDPGFGLMQALLEQWLGPNAISRNLRRLLSSPGLAD